MNDNIFKYNDKEFYFRMFLFLLIAMLLASPYASAYAAEDTTGKKVVDPMGESMCQIVGFLSGGLAKGLSVIVVSFIGIKVMTGQVREMFVSVIVPVLGISVLLTAPALLGFVFPALKDGCP